MGLYKRVWRIISELRFKFPYTGAEPNMKNAKRQRFPDKSKLQNRLPIQINLKRIRPARDCTWICIPVDKTPWHAAIRAQDSISAKMKQSSCPDKTKLFN